MLYDEAVRHTSGGGTAIEATGLGKRYGELWALRDLDLAVPTGSVLGLLGHNGAGKTTAIRILTTLAVATEGRAAVAGFDVTTDGAAVRHQIGVAAQEATVDGLLTGRGNLVMIGRLKGMSRREAATHADELLVRLDLADAADQLAKTYSGGMRRRLDLAASIVGHPPVLFLDEPTTGLDPRSRNELWDLLRGLVRDGTTILLTTQYLEEADRLADEVVLLDHGRTVAKGTPAQLKARIGGDRVDVTVVDERGIAAVVHASSRFGSGEPVVDADSMTVTVPIDADTKLMDVVRRLDADRVDIVDVSRRGATLDDVFLTLTSPNRVPEEVSA